MRVQERAIFAAAPESTLLNTQRFGHHRRHEDSARMTSKNRTDIPCVDQNSNLGASSISQTHFRRIAIAVLYTIVPGPQSCTNRKRRRFGACRRACLHSIQTKRKREAGGEELSHITCRNHHPTIQRTTQTFMDRWRSGNACRGSNIRIHGKSQVQVLVDLTTGVPFAPFFFASLFVFVGWLVDRLVSWWG
ncbi:uncharacterized protein J3D65DRAFT_462024 [Phyllosticta citribraziliensis]|uniref:Uncharacterized protein n=1 Tax=Phyllosticta citribraziliensis TaxID=989973 RepID=A0ABR1LGV1_9PEZI